MTGWWALAFVVLWLLVVVVCIVVIALARQVGTLHLRLGPRGALEIDDEGPALGEPISPLQARTARGPTVALGLTKWLVHQGAGLDLERHLANEAFAMELSSRSDDFREGIAALREKRPTQFGGR